jgi:hypothetical protein
MLSTKVSLSETDLFVSSGKAKLGTSSLTWVGGITGGDSSGILAVSRLAPAGKGLSCVIPDSEVSTKGEGAKAGKSTFSTSNCSGAGFV